MSLTATLQITTWDNLTFRQTIGTVLAQSESLFLSSATVYVEPSLL